MLRKWFDIHADGSEPSKKGDLSSACSVEGSRKINRMRFLFFFKFGIEMVSFNYFKIQKVL